MHGKAALVIIFNHRYDKNIALLEKLYKDRFAHIYYLVPFYDGERTDVISVYENSYQYQGYIAQGLRSFFRPEFRHYLFVADDLLLNPAINEDNYEDHFGLDEDTSFVPEPFAAHDLHNGETLRFEVYKRRGKDRFYWWRLMDLAKYRHRVEGLENASEMPTYQEAELRLKQHGFVMQPLTFMDLYGPPPRLPKTKASWKATWQYLKRLRHYQWAYKLDYPAVASFSDILIVSEKSIRKFAHYCGVFAANALFVEFAIPTALLLASDRVMTEPKLQRRGDIYWSYTERETSNYMEAMKPYGNDLCHLLERFPVEKLYIHPIKLSRWQMQAC